MPSKLVVRLPKIGLDSSKALFDIVNLAAPEVEADNVAENDDCCGGPKLSVHGAILARKRQTETTSQNL